MASLITFLLLLPLATFTAATKTCTRYNATYNDLVAPPVDDLNLIPLPSPYLGLNYAHFSALNPSLLTTVADPSADPNIGIYYTAASTSLASVTTTATTTTLNLIQFDFFGCTVRDLNLPPQIIPRQRIDCGLTVNGVGQQRCAYEVGVTESLPLTCDFEGLVNGVQSAVFEVTGDLKDAEGEAVPAAAVVYALDNLVYELCVG